MKMGFNPRPHAFVDISNLVYETDRAEWILGGEEGSVAPISLDAPPEVGSILWGLVSLTYYPEIDSTPGMQLLYNSLNQHPATRAERIYYPEPELKRYLLKHKIPLFSLESKLVGRSFDIIGISIWHIPQHLNIHPMFELLRISPDPETRWERGEPIVVAGGPFTMNPEPASSFFDLICIGEGEDWVREVTDLYRRARDEKWDRRRFLSEAAQHIAGTYAPELVVVEYNDSLGKITRSGYDWASGRVKKRLVDIAAQPVELFEHLILSRNEDQGFVKTIESARGCSLGNCRFCMLTFYRPYRERPAEKLKEAIDRRVAKGLDRVGLSAPNPTEHSEITEIGNYILEKGIRWSIQSERLDSFSRDSAWGNIVSGRRFVTVALEAAGQDIRCAINKLLPEETYLEGCRIAFEAGFQRLKVMAILENIHETPENLFDDWYDIFTKTFKLRDETNPRCSLLFSFCPMRPKPWTPFQWLPLTENRESFRAVSSAMELARRTPEGALRVRLQFAGGGQTRWIDVLFSRGDRRLREVLDFCFEKGWVGEFPWNNPPPGFIGQVSTFCEHRGIPVHKFIGGYGLDDDQPWDFVDLGISKAFLRKEYEKALKFIETPSCRTSCSYCGVCETYPEITRPDTIPFVPFERKIETFVPRHKFDGRVPLYLKMVVYREPEMTNASEHRWRIRRCLIDMDLEAPITSVRATSAFFKDGLNWEGVAEYQARVWVKRDQIKALDERYDEIRDELGALMLKRELGTLLDFTVSDKSMLGGIRWATVRIPADTISTSTFEAAMSKRTWPIMRGHKLNLSKGWEPDAKPPEGLVNVRDWVQNIRKEGNWIVFDVKKGGSAAEVVAILNNMDARRAMKFKPLVTDLVRDEM